jgi:hypothetical protein
MRLLPLRRILFVVAAFAVVLIYLIWWVSYAGIHYTARYTIRSPGASGEVQGTTVRVLSLTRSDQLADAEEGEPDLPYPGAVWVVAELEALWHDPAKEYYLWRSADRSGAAAVVDVVLAYQARDAVLPSRSRGRAARSVRSDLYGAGSLRRPNRWHGVIGQLNGGARSSDHATSWLISTSLPVTLVPADRTVGHRCRCAIPLPHWRCSASRRPGRRRRSGWSGPGGRCPCT